MLKMDKVSKVYQRGNKEIKALDNMSLNISKGDFVSIVGPSGSGKSTLLLMLGGMLAPSQGQIFLDHDSIYTLTAPARAQLRQQKIGFVFQTFNLIPYLSALQNVQVPLLLKGLEGSAQRERAQILLKRVGLSDRQDHLPSELSVGQQQRIALARMLANDPEIILADEPTGNLDPAMSTHVMDFLLELNREGRTLVLVTHDMSLAKKAHRMVTLS